MGERAMSIRRHPAAGGARAGMPGRVTVRMVTVTTGGDPVVLLVDVDPDRDVIDPDPRRGVQLRLVD